MKFTTSRNLLYALLCVLYLILQFTASYAQTTFAYRYENGHTGSSVRQLPDGNYIVLGGEDGYDMFQYEVWEGGDNKRNADIFLMKCDPFSKVIWQRTYGTDTTREFGRWMELTDDGGLIIAGSSTKETNVSNGTPMDSSDVVLMKVDADGELQWAKTYDSGGDDVGYCVQQTSDGGYLVSAFVDLQPISPINWTRAWLIKTDANGNVQWEAKYQYAIRDFDTGRPLIYVAKETMNGGFVIVGTTWSTHQADLYVMRINPDGTVAWAKSYDQNGVNLSGGYDIRELPDSSFIIAGFMDKNRNMMQTNYPYLAKIDKQGNLLKARLYDYNSFRDKTGFSSIQPTSDGGYIFCGKAGYGEMGLEIVLLKTDANLNMEWGKHYDDMNGPPLGGSINVIEASDGGFAMTGNFIGNAVALIKTDSNGNIPCHNSNPLLEIAPMVNTINWNPDTVQGYTMRIWTPGVDSLFEDTIMTCALNVPLPVTYASFTARPAGGLEVELRWSTAAELNNDFFEVERSADGNHFAVVGKISAGAAKGGNYMWQDEVPAGGTYFYRLRQSDRDGHSTVSEVRMVELEAGKLQVQNLWQADEKIIIDMISDAAASGEILLADMTGKVLAQKAIALNSGANRLELSAAGLPAGIYVVRMRIEGETFARKVVINR